MCVRICSCQYQLWFRSDVRVALFGSWSVLKMCCTCHAQAFQAGEGAQLRQQGHLIAPEGPVRRDERRTRTQMPERRLGTRGGRTEGRKTGKRKTLLFNPITVQGQVNKNFVPIEMVYFQFGSTRVQQWNIQRKWNMIFIQQSTGLIDFVRRYKTMQSTRLFTEVITLSRIFASPN